MKKGWTEFIKKVGIPALGAAVGTCIVGLLSKREEIEDEDEPCEAPLYVEDLEETESTEEV